MPTERPFESKIYYITVIIMNKNPSKTFKLRIKDVTFQDVDVQASNEDEAAEKLKEMYVEGEVVASVSGESGYVVILNDKNVELEEIACF